MRAGSVLDVPSLDAAPGSRVELHDVLLVADGDKVTVGTPTVPDALVLAEVVGHGKGEKVVNFKYKAKVRYRRKRGHRQGYTRLAVQEVRHGEAVTRAPAKGAAEPEPEAEAPAAAAPRRRRAAAAPAVEETPPPAEAPAEAAPRPRRSRAPRKEE